MRVLLRQSLVVVGAAWFTLAIGGCSGSTSTASDQTTPADSIGALEDSGEIPKLDRSPDAGGPDTNNDGVRDDVETYIQANYSTEPRRAAARQHAAVIRAAILVDKNDAASVKRVSIRGSRAVRCIYQQFDGTSGQKPAEVVEKIRAVSTNTKVRLKAYLAYAKALDGTSRTRPEGDTCE